MLDLRVGLTLWERRRGGRLQVWCRARDLLGEGCEEVSGESNDIVRLPEQQELHVVSEESLELGMLSHVHGMVPL